MSSPAEMPANAEGERLVELAVRFELQRCARPRQKAEQSSPLEHRHPLPTTPQLAPLPELSWENGAWQRTVAPVAGVPRQPVRGEVSLLAVAPIAVAGWQETAWIETVPGRSLPTATALWQRTVFPAGQVASQTTVAQKPVPLLPESRQEVAQLAALGSEPPPGLLRWLEHSEKLLLRLQQATEQLTQRAVAEKPAAGAGGGRHRRPESRRVKRWRRQRRGQGLRQRQAGGVPQEERGTPRWQGWLDGVSQRVKEKMTRMVAGAAAVTEDPAQDGWSIRAVNGWRRSGRRG